MPSPSSARLKGDDYQHLFSWLFVLELLMPSRKVLRVTLEDPFAGFLDDVTVQREPDADLSDEFYQIKYHVDHRSVYSSTNLIAHKPGEMSLLKKFWLSWKMLRSHVPHRTIELHLLTNWTWDSNDPFKSYIDGRDNSIKETFLTDSASARLGNIREAWKSELGADGQDFKSFISCLRFRIGFDCSDELERRTTERMNFLGLKSGRNTLLIFGSTNTSERSRRLNH